MSVTRIDSAIPYDSNIYLLKGRSAILIDAGTGLDSDNVIRSIWQALGGIRLSAVLLTHCHADHVGGLKAIVEEFGCPAYAYPPDRDVIEKAHANILVSAMMGLQLDPVPCKVLRDTDTFDIGDHRLQVIHTPGHTAGGVCFLDTVTNTLFSGDTVFAQGFGRTDLPTGNFEQLLHSLRQLRNINIGTLYPGHGPGTDDGNRAVRDAISMMEGAY